MNVLPGFTPVGTVKVSLEVAGIARAAIAGAWLPGRKPAVVVLEVWFPIVWCECLRICAIAYFSSPAVKAPRAVVAL